MPNKAAKQAKRMRRQINIRLKREGRTANQHRRFVKKEEEKSNVIF